MTRIKTNLNILWVRLKDWVDYNSEEIAFILGLFLVIIRTIFLIWLGYQIGLFMKAQILLLPVNVQPVVNILLGAFWVVMMIWAFGVTFKKE